MTDVQRPSAVGQNAWLVDEMYEQFLADPASVSASWQDFFADYGNQTNGGLGAANTTAAAATAQVVPPPPPTAAAAANGAAPAAATPSAPSAPSTQPADPTPAPDPLGEPIRGAAARIVTNMEASLAVPTATSFREIPARLLEVNRKIMNGYLTRTRGGKISFTHIIGYAVVRAISDAVPAMNASYVEDENGKPRKIRHDHVGLGIAVDVPKSDGSRTLMVVNVRDADTLDFRAFVDRYEEAIRKVRDNKLTPDDFAGITVSLTNPGTIGTVQSVPRLMPGQGLIVGMGTIAYPTEFQAADPGTLADLGISKITTVSSTYDHRIIQGAESGLFLKKVHELLLGEDDFYVDLLRSLGVPYEAVKWRKDSNFADRDEAMIEKQSQVDSLVNAYRSRGHLIADLDPLTAKEPAMHSELDPASYGLTIWDLEREFLTHGLMGVDVGAKGQRHKLADLLGILRDAYCRTTGVEYMHITDYDEKAWLQDHLEGGAESLAADEQLHILGRLNAAEALEKFLATKYLGQKRFGIEGAESTIPLLDALLSAAADDNMQEAVIGMAHRGRLNVLVNIVGKDYEDLFEEFEDTVSEEAVQGSGDVKYHLGQNGTFKSPAGNQISVELAANPSHLEAVDPVVLGMSRAKMDNIIPPGNYPVLPVLIHGDAAFAGQGVVAETLNLSQVKGYKVGGAVHVIINNQLGFTTAPHAARSSEYPTDVAKMVQAPIFHVNGDDPEACVRVARIAFEYRQKFNKDVVIDMVCYRRHGHNEGDDPSYTQPLMYRAIEARRSVRKLYVESLVKRGDFTIEQAEEGLDDFQSQLQEALTETRESAPAETRVAAEPPSPVGVLPQVETGSPRATLDEVFASLNAVPDGFTVHPKLARQFDTRAKMFEGGEVDWALAEAMAIGSLLSEGTSVRISGQDSRRGTFSHRHSTLVDYETADEYIPLEAMRKGSEFWIYDSLLSEYAALGFEYGYAQSNKDVLTVWEAQFGDFVNGAQIIIDQFIVAAEDKWNETTGLVMLLPHGSEGQGPEHSSGRMERFLLLCAEDNIQVANATTAAQFFHLLRRQMIRDIRKPLIVFTPKSMLRAREARSGIDELVTGSFQELLDDPAITDPASVERVIYCSGKVSYDAIAKRDELGANVAIIRIEQLYPWPTQRSHEILQKYSNAKEIVWLQEEPENMGAWNFAKGRLFEEHQGHRVKRVSRFESGSPATGSSTIHKQEQAQLLEKAFAPLD